MRAPREVTPPNFYCARIVGWLYASVEPTNAPCQVWYQTAPV